MRTSPRRVLALAAVLSSLPVASAAADTRVLGSPLTATPSFPGCEVAPQPALDGGQGTFVQGPSNQPDCTWYQSGVFGAAPGSTLTGGVPADGRVTNVAIKSGPNPGRLRIVQLRQLVRTGQSSCCFFVAETPELQPAPNAVTNFPVDIAVEHNTNPDTEIITQDWIGISGVSGTGELPIAAGSGPYATFQVGKPATGFLYPRLGAQPSDRGGGREDRAFSDAEILMQWTWTNDPAAGPGTGGQQPTPGGPPVVTTGPVPTGPPALTNITPAPLAIPGRLPIFATNDVVPLDVQCLLTTSCVGTATLRTRVPGARAAAAKLGVLYGKASLRVKAGKKAKVKVKLNATGRRVLRKKRTLRLVATVTIAGQPAVKKNVTVRYKKPAKKKAKHKR